MQQFEWISQNEEETAHFAQELAQRLSSGDVLALERGLGSRENGVHKRSC